MLAAVAIPVVDGDVIAGKYKVLGLLGRGGMGEVVAAEHLHLHHTVAIKFLSPRTPVSPEIVSRFLQEARATVRLNNEHVTRVLDMGTLDSGLPFIVMERLQGHDFEFLIETHGPLSIEQAALSVVQACEALAEAHAMGLVHRDLKPSNLFLTERPDDRWFVKVLDFGISKLSEEHGGEGITTTADVLGTPAYMSPELIRSAKLVDARTDIWALGLILAECITGKTVYQGTTKFAILASIAADPLPKLHLDRAGAPPELEKVILRCLEKDPDRRYQTVAELARDLVPFAGEKSISAASRIGRMVRPRGQRSIARGALMGAALLLAAGIVVAAALTLRARGAKTDASALGPVSNSSQRAASEPRRDPPLATNAEVEPSTHGPASAAASSSAESPHGGPKSIPKIAGPATKTLPRGPVDTHVVRPPTPSPPSDGLEDRK